MCTFANVEAGGYHNGQHWLISKIQSLLYGALKDAVISHQHTLLHPNSSCRCFVFGSYGDRSKPCTPGEPQNSWDLWMFITLNMVLIGIDP